MKTIGITRFPGTNCDQDTWKAVKQMGAKPEWLWYTDHFDFKKFDGIIIPGGFSYGDYLRTGALASRSAVMESVTDAANAGVPVLGICNGFQILCESGLLPGALVQNVNRRFIDEVVELECVNKNIYWGTERKTTTMPIDHGEGRFYAEDIVLKQLEDNEQIWLRYKKNPNGSLRDVAGIVNARGNVAGLMPHPERAMFDWMGSEDGKTFFEILQ